MKEGWKYKPLGSIGEFKRGGNFKKSDFVDDGMPCVHYGQIHMTFGTSTNQHLSAIPQSIYDKCTKGEKGDLLIAITSEDVEGSCKCTAWTGDYAVALGGHMARFRHNLNPLYVSYFFQSPTFQRAKKEYTHGFKVVEIKPSDIAKITIGFPSPEEQAAIVSKLDTAFAKIDKIIANAADALNEAQDYFATSLCDSFVPKEEWLTASVDKLALDVKYGTSKPSHADGDYIYLRMNNISNDGHLVLKDLKYISLPEKELEKCIVRKGDILFNRTNSYEHVGKTCVFNNDTPMVIAGYIIRVRLNDKIIPEFFSYFMNSACTKQVLRGLSVGAVHQSNISAKSLKKVNVFFPESIAEQRKIVESIQQQELKIKSLKENYDKIVSECMAMKQALLKEVFGD